MVNQVTSPEEDGMATKQPEPGHIRSIAVMGLVTVLDLACKRVVGKMVVDISGVVSSSSPKFGRGRLRCQTVRGDWSSKE
eukprot:3590833-Rhodomonas_salina.1